MGAHPRRRRQTDNTTLELGLPSSAPVGLVRPLLKNVRLGTARGPCVPVAAGRAIDEPLVDHSTIRMAHRLVATAMATTKMLIVANNHHNDDNRPGIKIARLNAKD